MGIARRRRRSRAPRGSMLVTVCGSVLSAAGLAVLWGALSLADRVAPLASADAPLGLGEVFVAPLALLLQGGLLSLAGGIALLVVGGAGLLLSA